MTDNFTPRCEYFGDAIDAPTCSNTVTHVVFTKIHATEEALYACREHAIEMSGEPGYVRTEPYDEPCKHKSQLITFAADEPTTGANQALAECYMQRWEGDFGYFCGQVVGLLACSLETEDFQSLLDRANETAKPYAPMLLAARNAYKQEVLQ